MHISLSASNSGCQQSYEIRGQMSQNQHILCDNFRCSLKVPVFQAYKMKMNSHNLRALNKKSIGLICQVKHSHIRQILMYIFFASLSISNLLKFRVVQYLTTVKTIFYRHLKCCLNVFNFNRIFQYPSSVHNFQKNQIPFILDLIHAHEF